MSLRIRQVMFNFLLQFLNLFFKFLQAPRSGVKGPPPHRKFSPCCFQQRSPMIQSLHFSASNAISDMVRLLCNPAHIFSSTVLLVSKT